MPKDSYETRSAFGNKDFSHTAPLWEDIIELGIVGFFDRVKKYASCKKNLSQEQSIKRELADINKKEDGHVMIHIAVL